MKNTFAQLLSGMLVGCCALINANAKAQTCTPLPTIPDTVLILPVPYQLDVDGSGIQDIACVGMPFMTSFNLKVPAVLETPFGLVPVNSIDMSTQSAITDLPASMDYVCNPSNCIFAKDSIGCIVIYGTAAPGSEGIYDLVFNVVVRSQLDIPLSLPDQTILIGNYFLYVTPPGDPYCQASSITVTWQTGIIVFPNPTTGVIQLSHIKADQAQVFDNMGRLIFSKAQPGSDLDISDVPPGMYFLKITEGGSLYFARVIKE